VTAGGLPVCFVTSHIAGGKKRGIGRCRVRRKEKPSPRKLMAVARPGRKKRKGRRQPLGKKISPPQPALLAKEGGRGREKKGKSNFSRKKGKPSGCYQEI